MVNYVMSDVVSDAPGFNEVRSIGIFCLHCLPSPRQYTETVYNSCHSKMADNDDQSPLDLSLPTTGASPHSQPNMSENRQSIDQEDSQQGNKGDDILSPEDLAFVLKNLSSSLMPYHSDAVMNRQRATPSDPANDQSQMGARHMDKCTLKSCLSTVEEVCLDCYTSVMPKLCNKCFRQRHPNHATNSTLSINAFFNMAQKTTKERNAATTPLAPSCRVSSTAATRDNNMGTRSEAVEVYKYMCTNAAIISSCEGSATVMCTQCSDYAAVLLCHRCDQGLHTSDSSGHVRVPLRHLTEAWSPEGLTVDTDIALQNNTLRGVHICADCYSPADMVCLDCEHKICLKFCPRHVGEFHRAIWSSFHYRIKLSDGTRIQSRVNGRPPSTCQSRVRGHCKNLATLVCLHCFVYRGLLICQTCDDFIHGDRLSRHRRIPVQQGTSEEQSVSSHRDPPQGDIGIRVNNVDNSGATLSARSVDAHSIADTVDGSNFDADNNSETEMEDAESVEKVESTYICHFGGCKQKADVICVTCADTKLRPMVLYCTACYAITHSRKKHNSLIINKTTNESIAQTSKEVLSNQFTENVGMVSDAGPPTPPIPHPEQIPQKSNIRRLERCTNESGVQAGAEAAVMPLDNFLENVEKDVVSGAGAQPTSLVQQPVQTPRKSNIKRRASAASLDSLDSIHERYDKVSKRVLTVKENLKSACEETGVAKQTFMDRVGIAELKIINPHKYQELEEEYRKSSRPTVKGFETRCREVIKTMFLEQVREARKDGKLLNLKTKAYD